MKRFASSVLAGLLMFGMAGLYTGVLARAFIASHVDPPMLRTPPNFTLIVAGYLLLGVLMAWLYPKVSFAASIGIVRRGLLFGAAVAILWLWPYSLVLFGVYRFPYAALPLDFSWALAEQGVGGLLIALMHERGW